MSRIKPDFSGQVRVNEGYVRDYGEDKAVYSPKWMGQEGDQAALARMSYPSVQAQAYRQGPGYLTHYRNLVTTALQGKGSSINQLGGNYTRLTGSDDFNNDGRYSKEYSMVALSGGSVSNTEIMVGMLIVFAAMAFIFMSR